VLILPDSEGSGIKPGVIQIELGGRSVSGPRFELPIREGLKSAVDSLVWDTGCMSDGDLDPADIKRVLPKIDAAEMKRLLASTLPSSVTDQWNRLSTLLIANLNVEYFGASDEVIDDAEAATFPCEQARGFACCRPIARVRSDCQ